MTSVLPAEVWAWFLAKLKTGGVIINTDQNTVGGSVEGFDTITSGGNINNPPFPNNGQFEGIGLTPINEILNDYQLFDVQKNSI